MDARDKKDFIAGLSAIAQAVGKELTLPTMRLYWIALCDLTVDEYATAIQRAIRETRFMPTPAELRELAGKTAIADDAEVAWGDVLRAVSACGTYRSVNFRDKAINAAIKLCGGWVLTCTRMSEDGEEKWVKQEFKKAYQACRRKGISDEEGRALPGLSGTDPVSVGEHRDSNAIAAVPLQRLLSGAQ